MQILYRGKSSTYIGECECETVILAKESEIIFDGLLTKCPECGKRIAVYEDGTKIAKDIRKNYQKKQEDDNKINASVFLKALEESQDINNKFDELKQILEEYADKENYYYQDHTSCTHKEAERGLLLLKKLKNTLT